MSVESRTVKPRATGDIRGSWSERFGTQRVEVHVDPGRLRADNEIRVKMDRHWGPSFTDTRTESFWVSREGAETLRDALTAALEWEAAE